MKKLFYLSILISLGLFTGCEKDDHEHHDHNEIVAPDTYSFERDGLSTVSFSGQTCRLQMATDIYNTMNEVNAASINKFIH